MRALAKPTSKAQESKSVSLLPDTNDVRRVLTTLTEWLQRQRVCDDRISDFEIVLAEYLNNVVEHSGMDRDLKISISVEVMQASLVCEV